MKIKLNNHTIDLSPNVNLNEFRRINAGNSWWEDILNFLEQWANEAPTISIKTSGSTGEPKQIRIEKAKMWVSASKTCEFFQLTDKSTGLLCLSANYIAGQMMLVRAMVSGMKLTCIEPTSNPVAELQEKIDFAAMVPMQVQESSLNIQNLNKVQNLLIGGGQVSTNLENKITDYIGKAYESFGMTETLSHIALRQIKPTNSDFFKPLSGISILQGYNNVLILDYPELGIYKLKTNDFIELKDNSGSFKWKGRTDFVINSGGVKISPEEVEKNIAPFINENFCIIGLPDEKLGEKVTLVIEGNPTNTRELINILKKNLSSYSIPKEIKFLAKLPLTETGKIKRKEISKLL